jgi:hypothetical protein
MPFLRTSRNTCRTGKTLRGIGSRTRFKDDGLVPNRSRWPFITYRSAIDHNSGQPTKQGRECVLPAARRARFMTLV